MATQYANSNITLAQQNVSIGKGRMAVDGALAGILSGIVMALVATIHSASVGAGFWTPVRAIAGTFYGENAFTGGFGPVLAGLVTHIIVSAGFGAIFGLMVRPTTRTSVAATSGLLYGIAIWFTMTYIVLPLVNPLMLGIVRPAMGWWFLEHLVYGGVLGITPALQRSDARNQGLHQPRVAA